MIDIEINRALRIIDRIIAPQRLNGVQELVLRECWLGKTYQEIADNSGYDSDYVRVVGSRLWQHLSQAFEEKISKHNFKLILSQKAKNGEFSFTNIELPNAQVPLNSNFYIERPPWETLAYEEILHPGALVVIKPAYLIGKTSLMMRILDFARSHNYKTVTLNFQLAEASILSNLEKFLRWLMANIAFQLGIEPKLDDYWDLDLGAKISCTNYLQEYVLKQLSEPLVLAGDEIDYLVAYPKIAQEFFPLLRFWHEEAQNFEIWQRLRMILVHPDNYFALKIERSPFNLGLPIVLPKFNFEQIKELASRHQFQLEVKNLEQSLLSLREIVGGHPYLIRLAFHALSTQEITFEQLLAEAPTPSGIYYSHLQERFMTLQQDPELVSLYSQIITADSSVPVFTIAAHRLKSMGLIEFTNNQAVSSCQLYRLYFRDYL
ncbi:AAA-like domain-containing protein [Pleurocapsales cyanobacterium LEGE 10410]|nr:AAA-like domain-containing protein [Pleurocapsales cyanobacterium LEGE 10410]